MEPGSSQRCAGKGQGENLNQMENWKIHLDISVFTMRVVKLWNGVQRGGGTPVLGDSQTSTTHGPEQLDPAGPVLTKG